MDGMTRQDLASEGEIISEAVRVVAKIDRKDLALLHFCQSDPGDETDENV